MISSLMEDETVFVVPWSITADVDGRLWINGEYSFSREPHGTLCVRITRSGNSILVDQDSIGDHTYERRPLSKKDNWLPVILR